MFFKKNIFIILILSDVLVNDSVESSACNVDSNSNTANEMSCALDGSQDILGSEDILEALNSSDVESPVHFELDNIEIEYLSNLQIVTNEPKPLTTSIRCSAHTLQLCIEDALKTRLTNSIISKARLVILIYNV